MSVMKFLPYAFNKGHTSQYIGVVLMFLAFAFLGFTASQGAWVRFFTNCMIIMIIITCVPFAVNQSWIDTCLPIALCTIVLRPMFATAGLRQVE